MRTDHPPFVGGLSCRDVLRLVGASGAVSMPAACQAAPSVPAAATPAASGQAPAAASGSAGQVVVLQGVDANTLDPSFRNSTPESSINQHIFSTMTWRDAKSPKAVPEFLQESKLVG